MVVCVGVSSRSNTSLGAPVPGGVGVVAAVVEEEVQAVGRGWTATIDD
jgi:hypothetical protein